MRRGRPLRASRGAAFRAVIGLVVDDEERVLMLWRHRFLANEWGARFQAAPEASEESGRIPWIPLADIKSMLTDNEVLGSGSIVGLLHILAFGSPAG
jgi:hypothetical protein